MPLPIHRNAQIVCKRDVRQWWIIATATATITAIAMPTTITADKTLIRNTITAMTIAMPTTAIMREIKSNATNHVFTPLQKTVCIKIE